VKLYPCFASGGPRYVRALRGQYPHIEFVASGGVTLENCAEYVYAGACAVGVGGEIADHESMISGNHRLFTERARRFRKAIVAAQNPPNLLSA
jgi:2-dehydro-3-deoxyphosphogluconate aldolase/(4S)-4-hydroxy-2-oxoglutarate aldolase